MQNAFYTNLSELMFFYLDIIYKEVGGQCICLNIAV